MNDALMEQGLTLMLAGMGTVFVFLTALVIAMTLMSKLARRIQPETLPDDDDADIVAAIAAAITRHRRR